MFRKLFYGMIRGQDRKRILDLEIALSALIADIEDYERVNKLSPSPGKADCWQSVTHAKAVLARE